MPVHTDRVGQRLKAWTGRVDARWLMAYAAGIGRTDPELLDTTRSGGVVGHPVFPVAPEWQLLTAPDSGHDLGLIGDESYRGVHAANDGFLHRTLHQDVEVTVEAEVTAARGTRAGALVTTRFDGIEVGGAPLWTTWMSSLFRGVEAIGEDVCTVDAPALPELPTHSAPVASTVIALSPVAGHVYNECARVWNPIHSDYAVARAAGLDRPILHGSATFAAAVSAVADFLRVDVTSVARCGVAFRGMIECPSTVLVEVLSTESSPEGDVTGFQVRNEAGQLALRDGFVVTR